MAASGLERGAAGLESLGRGAVAGGRKALSVGAGLAASGLEHGATGVEYLAAGAKNLAAGAGAAGMAAGGNLLNKVQTGAGNVWDKHRIMANPEMRKRLAEQAGGVTQYMGNAGLRSGAMYGSLAGAALGAAAPGEDADGDERSMIGGALRGAAGGGILGGALGLGSRHLLVNPNLRSEIKAMGGGTQAREVLSQPKIAAVVPAEATTKVPETLHPNSDAKPHKAKHAKPPMKSCRSVDGIELPAIK